MKILTVVQQFRQGWGGGPESIRLLAKVLSARDVTVDVFDLGKFWPAVETLDVLPREGSPATPFEFSTMSAYDAILVAGPWQNWRWLREILRHRQSGQPIFYLPRGGLGQIEFARPRDLKKWPYFLAFERQLIKASNAVIYSSQCEQGNTIALARGHRRELVIPDFFQPLPAVQPRETLRERIRFAFMAEIAPRKGLLPLLRAFRQFAAHPSLTVPVELIIGGGVRKGSERYHRQAIGLAAAPPGPVTIEFAGPIAHGSRPEYYRDTDVFLTPSLFESFGLTVLEALVAGCATIAGCKQGVLEFLPTHQRLGIVDVASSDDFVANLLRQYDLAKNDRMGGRDRTSAMAFEAIESINRLATSTWLDLLKSERAG